MPPLTTIRPTVPEPEITAGGLADPLGDLAAPTHLKIEQYLPGDVLGGAHPAPRLSWEIASAPAGWAPTGADLEITRTDAAGTPWASPKSSPLRRPTACSRPGPPRPWPPATAWSCGCA